MDDLYLFKQQLKFSKVSGRTCLSTPSGLHIGNGFTSIPKPSLLTVSGFSKCSSDRLESTIFLQDFGGYLLVSSLPYIRVLSIQRHSVCGHDGEWLQTADLALRLTAARTTMTARLLNVDPRGEQRRKHNLTSGPSAAKPFSHIDTGCLHVGVHAIFF